MQPVTQPRPALALMLLVMTLAACNAGDAAREPDEASAVPTRSSTEQRDDALVQRLRRARRNWLQTSEGRAEQVPQVVRMLIELGPRVIPQVLPELESPNAETRYFATQVLAGVGDSTLSERMVAMVADPDPDVALAATDALGRLRDESTVPLLFRALETGQVRQVRWGLVVASVRPADRELVPFLIRRLLDGNESSRVSASLLLSRITGEDIPFDPGASPEAREIAAMRWERWWHRAHDGFTAPAPHG